MSDTTDWTDTGAYTDISYRTSPDGIALITIERPHKRNAFRPLTSAELVHAFATARHDRAIRVVLLRGAGQKAFCSGVDLSERTGEGEERPAESIAPANILDVQVAIRRIEKPVIALVAGFAVGGGGGQVLHQVCDLSIAADNAVFGQVGPRVGSFDGGYGINLLSKQVGHKRAKEMWFLCRQYSADKALEWGLVNAVVPIRRPSRGRTDVGPRTGRHITGGAAATQEQCQCRRRRPTWHRTTSQRPLPAVLRHRGSC